MKNATRSFQIILVTSWFPPTKLISGVGESSFRLAQALVDKGHQVTVICSDADLNRRLLPDDFKQVEHPGLRIRPYRYILNKWIGYTVDVPYLIRDFIQTSDVFILNEMFCPASISAAKQARKFNKPYIIIPHGNLLPNALKQSNIRKRLFMYFAGKKLLRFSAAISATSFYEKNAIQSYGFNVPIHVIPNGCVLLPLTTEKEKRLIEEKWPQLKNKKIVLCLTRISREKGIDLLLNAWKKIVAVYNNLILVIAGGSDVSLMKTLRQLTTELQIEKSVFFTGTVVGNLKNALYGKADIFVLPSHTENFGNVIAEALMHEKPVVTTKGTPWSELEEYKCGRWVDTSISGLSEGLSYLLNLDHDELNEMGMRGRRLIMEKYSWDKVADKMTELIEEVIG